MEHSLEYHCVIPSHPPCDQMQARRVSCTVEHPRFIEIAKVSILKERRRVKPDIDPLLSLPLLA